MTTENVISDGLTWYVCCGSAGAAARARAGAAATYIYGDHRRYGIEEVISPLDWSWIDCPLPPYLDSHCSGPSLLLSLHLPLDLALR